MLPVVVEIILIQKAFTKTKTELGQPNAVWVIGEGEASLVRNAVIFAVDVKTIKWNSIDLAGEPFLELTLPIKSDKRRGDCNMPASPPKVFISYSHDSFEHVRRVMGLAERLRKDGVDAQLDQYVAGTPARGWPRWMEDQCDPNSPTPLICDLKFGIQVRTRRPNPKAAMFPFSPEEQPRKKIWKQQDLRKLG